MENKKEIGNAFKDKLNLLDKSPNETVWETIRHDLQKKKKRTIFVPFWLTCASIFTFTIFLSSYLYQDTIYKTLNIHSIKLDGEKKFSPIGKTDSKNTLNEITLNKKDSLSIESRSFLNKKGSLSIEDRSFVNKKDSLSIENRRFLNKNPEDSKAAKTSFVGNKIISSTDKRKNSFKEISSTTSSKKIAHSRNTKKRISKKKNLFNHAPILKSAIDTNPFLEKNESKSISAKTSLTRENDIVLAGTETVKTDSLIKNPKKILNKEKVEKEDIDSLNTQEKENLAVFIYGSPTYSGMFSNKSPIDKTLDNNNITSEITFSYGAYLTYNIDQKWSLRFGVGINNMKLITKDDIINTTDYYNINYTQGISNVDLYNKSDASKSINIIQDISYIEIPFEVKYNITDAKFGIGFFGGLSYLHLNQNKVSFETSSNTFLIGETKELSDNTYSLNMGLNLNYKISKTIKFNIEPVFKYHLMDYNNSEKINPYTIGIQTGLEFIICDFK